MEVLQSYHHDRGKGVRKETIYFYFQIEIVHHDSYQADEIIMEIEEWKQKVAGVYAGSFSRGLLGVLETSVLS